MRRLVTLLVLAAVAAVAAADEPPLPEVAAALSRIQDRSTIELTTTGRKSGNEHTKPIWFVVSDGKIVVQAGKDGKTDWYQNLVKTPTGVARQDAYLFRVRARPVTEPAHERTTNETREREPHGRTVAGPEGAVRVDQGRAGCRR